VRCVLVHSCCFFYCYFLVAILAVAVVVVAVVVCCVRTYSVLLPFFPLPTTTYTAVPRCDFWHPTAPNGVSTTRLCNYFFEPRGCAKDARCDFLHVPRELLPIEAFQSPKNRGLDPMSRGGAPGGGFQGMGMGGGMGGMGGGMGGMVMPPSGSPMGRMGGSSGGADLIAKPAMPTTASETGNTRVCQYYGAGQTPKISLLAARATFIILPIPLQLVAASRAIAATLCTRHAQGVQQHDHQPKATHRLQPTATGATLEATLGGRRQWIRVIPGPPGTPPTGEDTARNSQHRTTASSTCTRRRHTGRCRTRA
jgi:hypothetical protein